MARPVFVTGAAGFVGAHLRPALTGRGSAVRCGTRRPDRAPAGGSWVRFDLDAPETLVPALRGCSSAVYLVHGMAGGRGYAERERRYATSFASAAAAAEIERIVYLGAVTPHGSASRHLRSRIVTGEILRAGAVPVFELRASMIVGHGSTSWKIVRDLAYRLPAMVLPRWLDSRIQPVAIDDVVYALALALELPLERAGVYDLPGPETLTAKDVLLRTAAQHGGHPLVVDVPVLTPRLSSYWLKLVSGADYDVARELVDGLASDLLAQGPELWELAREHRRVPFDEAVRRALAEAAR